MNITYEQWVEQYGPLTNSDGDIIFFETFGEDAEVINKTNLNNVWTLVDGGDYCGYVAGIQRVNSMNFVICNTPWDNEQLYVDIYEMTLCDMGEHIWVDHKRYDGTAVIICNECERDKNELDELSEVA